VRIRVESCEEQPFTAGCDVRLVGPFVRPLDAAGEREATVTLVGSLLDGGYGDE
jgi:hypothetical protein